MRAKKINEVQNFTQGGDPYKKLNIGKYDENYNDWNDPYHEDHVELQENVYYIYKLELYKDFMTETKLKNLLEQGDSQYLKGHIFRYDPDDDAWISMTCGYYSLSRAFVSQNRKSFKKLRNNESL